MLASGRGSNYQAVQNACDEGRVPAIIAAVICDRPGATVLDLAGQADTDTVLIDPARFDSKAAFEQSLSTAIEGFDPSYIVMAGFMRVLGGDLVRRHAGKMLNIHPSLLPRHRGLNTHRRALEAGDSEHGASVHFVTPKLDGGPIISQARLPVHADDTPDLLADRILPLEHRLYPATLALLLGYPVEYRDEKIYFDNQPIDDPFLLGRDLDDNGRVLEQRGGLG